MQFPGYQVPVLGKGMVIGLNAVIHVLISHGVAIGAFGMIWLALRRAGSAARDEDRAAWSDLADRLLGFSVPVVTVAGAATGAGIWFTIGALAPRATGSMLRVFFWPWFGEWFVFLAEILFILFLYWRWERWSRARRERFTGVYLVLAILSAVLITGILGFMLTPGGWPADRSLAAGFLNPSFLPQLVVRLALAFLLGAGIGMAAVSFTEGPGRGRRLRPLGVVALASLAALAAGLGWYAAVVPPFYLTRLRVSVLTGHLADVPWLFDAFNLAAVGVLLALGGAAALGRVRATRWLLVPGAVMAVALVTEFERVREFSRGPFLVPGYMWAGEVLLEEGPIMDRRGAVGGWVDSVLAGESEVGVGARAFARSCMGCHTIGGINAITDRVEGRSEVAIRVLLDHTSDLVSFMPPFVGTPRERDATARFLHEITTGRLRLRSAARAVPLSTDTADAGGS